MLKPMQWRVDTDMSNKNIQLPQLWVVNVKEGAGDSEPPKKGGGTTPLSLSEVHSYIPPLSYPDVSIMFGSVTLPLFPLPFPYPPPLPRSGVILKKKMLHFLCCAKLL